MTWVEVLRAFFAICGLAVAVFVVVMLRKVRSPAQRDTDGSRRTD